MSLHQFIIGVLFSALLLAASAIASAFCFEDAGRSNGIYPRLLREIACQESSLRANIVKRNRNGTFDIGLMQINSRWIKRLGLDPAKLISDPCYNAHVGAKILKDCFTKYGDSWEAVGCYHAVSHDERASYARDIYKRLKHKGRNL